MIDFKSLFLNEDLNGIDFPKSLSFFLDPGVGPWLHPLLLARGVVEGPVVLGKVDSRAYLEGQVFVDEGASIEPFSYIKGPCFIGKGSEVRHAAYIRGSVYLGVKCVVGHTTEVKNSVFLNGAKAGHFAYVGDSVLGERVNLGAGVKLANLKLRQDKISFFDPFLEKRRTSEFKKWGAWVGDDSQIGCNAVLSPGSVLKPRTLVMPNQHFHQKG